MLVGRDSLEFVVWPVASPIVMPVKRPVLNCTSLTPLADPYTFLVDVVVGVAVAGVSCRGCAPRRLGLQLAAVAAQVRFQLGPGLPLLIVSS